MLDRFIAFLKNLPEPGDRSGTDDPRVAVAALLFHLMDADGVRDAAEAAQLPALLTGMLGVDGGELKRLMAAGEQADDEAVDLYAFTSVINRHFDQEARRDLIESMWELVFADGDLHELEDNVVWRIAELLHVEREERVALRRKARAAAGIASD